MIVTRYQDLSHDARRLIRRWDKKYYDSGLRRRDIDIRHTQQRRKFLYFFSRQDPDTLYGYVEYRVSQKDRAIHLKWIVAPGNGKTIVDGASQYFRQRVSNDYSFVLSVSLDPLEDERAGVARLNLYYRLGFIAYRADWQRPPLANVIIRMRRPIT